MRILFAAVVLFAGSALAFGEATTPYKAPTQSLIVKAQNSIACEPISPPIPRGCVLGACVCDQHGHHYQ